MSDVTRVRMYVTDISLWQEFGSTANTLRISGIPNTMVEVKGLVDPQYLVEIEVSAVETNSNAILMYIDSKLPAVGRHHIYGHERTGRRTQRHQSGAGIS